MSSEFRPSGLDHRPEGKAHCSSVRPCARHAIAPPYIYCPLCRPLSSFYSHRHCCCSLSPTACTDSANLLPAPPVEKPSASIASSFFSKLPNLTSQCLAARMTRLAWSSQTLPSRPSPQDSLESVGSALLDPRRVGNPSSSQAKRGSWMLTPWCSDCVRLDRKMMPTHKLCCVSKRWRWGKTCCSGYFLSFRFNQPSSASSFLSSLGNHLAKKSRTGKRESGKSGKRLALGG